MTPLFSEQKLPRASVRNRRGQVAHGETRDTKHGFSGRLLSERADARRRGRLQGGMYEAAEWKEVYLIPAGITAFYRIPGSDGISHNIPRYAVRTRTAPFGAPAANQASPSTAATGTSTSWMYQETHTRDKWRGDPTARIAISLQARGVSQREFRGFHETRDTKHESRLFPESRPFCRVGRPLMREGGRPAGFKGGCTKRGKTNGKEFF